MGLNVNIKYFKRVKYHFLKLKVSVNNQGKLYFSGIYLNFSSKTILARKESQQNESSASCFQLLQHTHAASTDKVPHPMLLGQKSHHFLLHAIYHQLFLKHLKENFSFNFLWIVQKQELEVTPNVKYAALSFFADRFYPSLSRSYFALSFTIF